jgi:hypothetical protein
MEVLGMKKFIIPAGLICSAAIAGTVMYRKVKKGKKDDIIFYPMGRYIIHTNENFFDLKQLVNNADLVLTGTVSGKSKPRWNNKENVQPKNVSLKDTVYFDYSIIPTKIYKGTAIDSVEINLRTFEGFVGGYTIEDNSQVKLYEGQELMVFLNKGKNRNFKYDHKEYYTAVGNLQGVFIEADGFYENNHEKFGKNELTDKINYFIINNPAD